MTSPRNWQAHLNPFEAAQMRELDREIAALDERRVTLAARRLKLVNRGAARARLASRLTSQPQQERSIP